MNSRFTPVLLVILLSILHVESFGQSTGNIKLNQLGFYPNADKIAVVTGDVLSSRLYVLGLPSHDTIYKATLQDTISSKWSSPITRIARFTEVKKPGNYVIYV